jgi:uracil-DNA glycosylase
MDFSYLGRHARRSISAPRLRVTVALRILKLMTGLRLTVLIGSYAQKHYLGTSAKESLAETVRPTGTTFRTGSPRPPLTVDFRWQAKNAWFETEVIPLCRRLSWVLSLTDSGLRTSRHHEGR